MWQISTHLHVVSENIAFRAQDPLILLMSAFFLEKSSVFYQKMYLCSKQQCESCVRDFLVLFSAFVKQKVTITENITFADSVAGIRSLDCSKLAKNLKTNNDVTIFRHDLNVNFFLTLFCFSCQFWLMVQLSCQYRHWFWNYSRLSFAQYLETGVSYGYQIWHECL